jgi:hypothetical protein
LGKRPILLRRILFTGPGRPSKSLEISSYRMEKGKYAPGEWRVAGGDGLVSLRLLMTPRANPLAQDKAWAPEPGTRVRDPRLQSRDGEEGTE